MSRFLYTTFLSLQTAQDAPLDDFLELLSSTSIAANPNIDSQIIPIPKTTVGDLEAMRLERECDLAILYDVSPGGTTPQNLFDELFAHPRIVILDHHNACSPMLEVPENELTAAEVVATQLPLLDRARLFQKSDGAAARILIVTNAMNVDPDAFISRFLLTS